MSKKRSSTRTPEEESLRQKLLQLHRESMARMPSKFPPITPEQAESLERTLAAAGFKMADSEWAQRNFGSSATSRPRKSSASKKIETRSAATDEVQPADEAVPQDDPSTD